MTDYPNLIKRLRIAAQYRRGEDGGGQLLAEAADEIEALRAGSATPTGDDDG